MSASALRQRLPRLLFAAWLLVESLAQTARAAPTPLEVAIEGVSGDTLENVRASLTIVQRNAPPGQELSGIRQLHAQAVTEITRALQPFGYYRPTVDAALDEPPAPGLAWKATYTIDPGPPLLVGSLDLHFPGTQDPALQRLAQAFPLQTGTTLDHRRYETAKRELLQDVLALGYRDAKWRQHRVEVDLEAYEARVQLTIATGPRFVIGPISFEQRRFDAAWLRRYLVLEPGQPYTSEALAEQRRVLGRSGYFNEVEIRPLPATGAGNGDPQIPLRIALGDYPANRYRGSVGWGTDTGFGIQLDWTRRYVGERGQRFNAGLAVAEERERLAGDINYSIPLQPLSGHAIELAARHESKDLSYEDLDLLVGGDTRIATNLASTYWRLPQGRWGQYEYAVVPGVSLVTETYDVFEVLFGYFSGEDQQAIIDSIGEEAYDTLAPDFEAVVASIDLTLRRADSDLFIRNGEYVGLELLGASENLGSNISFWQASLESWFIRPVFSGDRVLLRANLGYSDADSREVLDVNFNRMPEYYEFRAGGVRSVRGYGWEELVPAGSITGGRHLAVGSIEYEYEVIPDWSLALFLDGGNAFNEFDDIDPKLGTGFGVRWRSPVGVARLDFGVPLDDSEDSFQIYITVGPEF